MPFVLFSCQAAVQTQLGLFLVEVGLKPEIAGATSNKSITRRDAFMHSIEVHIWPEGTITVLVAIEHAPETKIP